MPPADEADEPAQLQPHPDADDLAEPDAERRREAVRQGGVRRWHRDARLGTLGSDARLGAVELHAFGASAGTTSAVTVG